MPKINAWRGQFLSSSRHLQLMQVKRVIWYLPGLFLFWGPRPENRAPSACSAVFASGIDLDQGSSGQKERRLVAYRPNDSRHDPWPAVIYGNRRVPWERRAV